MEEEVEWKEGKDVTVEKTTKKLNKKKGSKGGANKSVESISPRPSFFRTFFR
jgi:hypothetical protein